MHGSERLAMAPAAPPRQHAGPVPLLRGIGELLRVPAAAADLAGAVQRSNRSDAETAAQLALARGQWPGSFQKRIFCTGDVALPGSGMGAWARSAASNRALEQPTI